ASNNVIQGNALRANGISTGNNSGQGLGGILLAASHSNQIKNNDISGNTGSAVFLVKGGAADALTSHAIDRRSHTGRYITGAPGNFIGQNGAGNMIADNAGSGVDLQGTSTTGNAVLANTILRSGQDGVYLFNAASNSIGGTNAGDG